MSTLAVYRGDPTRDERYKQAVAYRWVQAWQTAHMTDMARDLQLVENG